MAKLELGDLDHERARVNPPHAGNLPDQLTFAKATGRLGEAESRPLQSSTKASGGSSVTGHGDALRSALGIGVAPEMLEQRGEAGGLLLRLPPMLSIDGCLEEAARLRSASH
jgi:hypothetical protein